MILVEDEDDDDDDESDTVSDVQNGMIPMLGLPNLIVPPITREQE